MQKMTANRIFITGDMHSNINAPFERVSQIENPTEDDVIIVCGDFGAEYDYITNENFEQECRKQFPGKWIILRGNHDSRYWEKHTRYNFNRFKVEPKDDCWSTLGNDYLFENDYPSILYTRDDGGIYDIGDYTFLFLPGAYSVDKSFRIVNGYPYVEDEQLTKGEMEALAVDIQNFHDDIDFVVSHTYPRSVENVVSQLFIGGINQSKVDKTTEDWLGKVDNYMKFQKNFRHWYFGHMHYDMPIDDKHTLLFNEVVQIK